MFHRGQQQFVELPPVQDHRNVLFRILSKPRDDQAGLILLSRAAVCGEEVV